MQNEAERNLELLNRMVQNSTADSYPVDLKPLAEIITSIWERMRDCAPAEFAGLYADFCAEFEKFKDFLLYAPLIGKNIVALGGGFSSGKSSFLNALMSRGSGSKWTILPEDIDPSTSVPTYLVHGDTDQLLGINAFECCFEMPLNMIGKIAHGFGTSEEDTEGIKLGHIVRNMFLKTRFIREQHIAFLDTPGYSKPDAKSYSEKTDEEIARRQLQGADYILWFVPVDAGTIHEEDLTFLQSLQCDIPKLIILSKADKVPDESLEERKAHISQMLKMHNISFDGICAFSAEYPDDYDIALLEECLSRQDHKNEQNHFAENFKRLFLRMRDYYDEELGDQKVYRTTLNQAQTLIQDSDINDKIRRLLRKLGTEMDTLQAHKDMVREMQDKFFRELKFVGDQVGIPLPEPSEIDLIGDAASDPLSVLREYLSKKGMKVNPALRDALVFPESAFEMNRDAGGAQYKETLKQALDGLSLGTGTFQLNDYWQQDDFGEQLGALDGISSRINEEVGGR